MVKRARLMVVVAVLVAGSLAACQSPPPLVTRLPTPSASHHAAAKPTADNLILVLGGISVRKGAAEVAVADFGDPNMIQVLTRAFGHAPDESEIPSAGGVDVVATWGTFSLTFTHPANAPQPLTNVSARATGPSYNGVAIRTLGDYVVGQLIPPPSADPATTAIHGTHSDYQRVELSQEAAATAGCELQLALIVSPRGRVAEIVDPATVCTEH